MAVGANLLTLPIPEYPLGKRALLWHNRKDEILLPVEKPDSKTI